MWEALDYDVADCMEYAENSPAWQFYRNNLFTRIVPCIRDIGLWGDTVQKAYADMGATIKTPSELAPKDALATDRVNKVENAIDGDFRIRFMTSHPKDLSDEAILERYGQYVAEQNRHP